MTNRASLVAAALRQVRSLRSSAFHGDDAAVCRLLSAYGDSQRLAELLWADLPDGCLLEDVADLVALWSWRTNDNGAAIMRTLESWIVECAGESKVWVALHQEAYPFIAHTDRIGHLYRVIETFPSLAPRCEAMISQSRLWVEKENQGTRPCA